MLVDLRNAAFSLGALGLAALLTGVARRAAMSRGVLDIPNERSSHRTATPRGGGVSIVAVVTLTVVILGLSGAITAGTSAVFLGGGVAVASVGFLDDRSSVSAGARFAVHVAAAGWAVWLLGGLPPLWLGDRLVSLGWSGYVLAVLGIVWVLNLFNFMDGIDGIAASEAMFVVGAGSLLTLKAGAAGMGTLSWVFGGACGGFLIWNWPPAKIFMGDVGSGYIGYLIAVLALSATRDNPGALWVWLILGGVFFVDSTVTLLRRALRGEQAHLAHRSHAYQWLARRYESHLLVTIGVTLLNAVWLLPWAMYGVAHPSHAIWAVVGALAPLIPGALWAGAGRREYGPTSR